MSPINNRASAQFLGLWTCGQTEEILFTVRFEESGSLRHFRIDDSTAVRVLQASVTTLRELGLNIGIAVKSDLDAAEEHEPDDCLSNGPESLNQQPQTLIAEVVAPTVATFESTPVYRLAEVEPALYVDEYFEESQGLAFHFEPEESDDTAPLEYPLFALPQATQFIASLIEGVTQLGYELDLDDEGDSDQAIN